MFICQLLQSLSVQRRSQSQSSFLSFALRPEISDIFSQLSGVYLLIQQLCNVTATVFPLLLPLSLPFHPIITQGTSILSSHMRRKCSCGISHHVISGATMLGALKSCSCLLKSSHCCLFNWYVVRPKLNLSFHWLRQHHVSMSCRVIVACFVVCHHKSSDFFLAFGRIQQKLAYLPATEFAARSSA